jgi:integrase
LRDLTPSILVEHRDALLAQFQPGTVAHYFSVLSHLCSIAVREWEWLDDNPVRRITKPREPRGRVRFLSDDERTRLLAVCQAHRNPRLSPLVLLALSTGMRKMELLSLRWSAVDLARRVITVEQTKNGERRTIPLTDTAIQALRQLGKVRRLDTALLFPAHRKPQVPMDVDTVWQTVCKRAELVDFRFHDLRHSCASYLAMSGASLLDIATILGHKTLSMAQRYSHLSEQHTAGVLQRMTQTVFGKR